MAYAHSKCSIGQILFDCVVSVSIPPTAVIVGMNVAKAGLILLDDVFCSLNERNQSGG